MPRDTDRRPEKIRLRHIDQQARRGQKIPASRSRPGAFTLQGLMVPGAGRRLGLEAVSPRARLLAGRQASDDQVCFSKVQSTARKSGLSRRSRVLFSRLCRSISSMASCA